ncbi:MAG: glycosyltransferase [Verrucomicrobiota bacterium]|nr:glycosyltransferase [Verrucomicrobiota bacterium]
MKKIINMMRDFVQKDVLPAYILCYKPIVLVSYEFDFVKNSDEILETLPKNKKIYAMLMLGWHRETEERIEELVQDIATLKKKNKNIEYVIMANCQNEYSMIKNAGLDAIFCHQNAFLNPDAYHVIPKINRKYDAIYIARVTPFKRHELTKNIKKLKLIGSNSFKEKKYFDKTLQLLSHADWIRGVRFKNIYKAINQAKVGLCLSEEEGAMFVSAEYLLCGLPIVNTKNLGGRDSLFDEEYVITTEPTPDAVNKAMQKLINKNIDPIDIREKTIEKMNAHRQTLIDFIQNKCDLAGIEKKYSAIWENVYTQKLGIRTTVPIFTKQRKRVLKKGMTLD